MSTDSDKQEHSRLQHEAEHERPHRHSSVLLYLVILFTVAFLLLLMSYFTQQRVDQEAMDKLEQTSDSATQSLENILQENEALKVENEALSQRVAQFQGTLEDTESASDGEAVLVQLEALCHLGQIHVLCNGRRYSDTRDAAATAETTLAGTGGMEGVLGTVADRLTSQRQQDYNLLGTYQSLMEWLD